MDNVTRLLMQGAAGAAGGSTYVDDVFSTTLYRGNDSSNTITTNIDSSSNDSLLWIKNRSNTVQHQLFDTVRGANKVLKSNSSDAEYNGTGVFNQTFTSTGFTLNNSTTNVNSNNNNYASWSFRKQRGFFDIVTYSGNATSSSSPARQIAHNLGCIPGMIMVKCTTQNQGWAVYHRSNGNWKWIGLNSTNASASSSAYWNDTFPTSTHFTVKHDGQVNENGHDYVAYLFAGGESLDTNAHSVYFDGTDDKLSIADHADLRIGSSTYTMEFWVYKQADTPDNYDVWAAKGSNSNNTREWAIESFTDQRLEWWYATSGSNWNYFVVADRIETGQWTHICAQKDSSGYFSFFVNGVRTYYSTTGAQTLNTGPDAFCIGGFADSNNNLDSNIKVSNFRFIKGTALYTTSFKPSTKPLTNITNTKLLCCNGSSVTSSTVTPSTITALGNPIVSHSVNINPFDDSDGYKFGENEDQNLIKCGRYTGRGNGPIDVELGWEPQWLMVKNGSTTSQWIMFDNMRGTGTGVPTEIMWANSDSNEGNFNVNQIDFTPTGFKVNITGNSELNQTDQTHIYLAIRRSDGLVGKPPEAGTDVFAMDTGTQGNGEIPCFDSGFVVDYGLVREPASSSNWFSGSRLTGDRYMYTDSTQTQAQWTAMVWDSNVGFIKNQPSSYQAWMWKRHAGFDVVTYNGNGTIGRQMPHSLGVTPEMIWVKRRNANEHWYVYHKGVNGGTNPGDYMLYLNGTDSQIDHDQAWNNSLPTSTHFILGNDTAVNSGGTTQYIAMLFASANDADGNPISKVGYYTGNGSSTGPTITTGFTPRFLIVKNASWSHGDWFVYDTTRGWASGDDKTLKLNSASAQLDNSTWNIDPTSTGFTVQSNDGAVNANGNTFIYYAHA